LTSFFAPRKSGGNSSSSSSNRGTTTTTAAAATAVKASPQVPDTPLPTNTNDAIIPHTVPWSESNWKVYQNAVLYRKPSPSSVVATAKVTAQGDDTTNNQPQSPRTNKVAAFDVDGTLVTWRTAGWPSKLTDYELWNANVVHKLRHLYDVEGYQLVLISNQGAIRSAHTGKKATTVKSLMEWIIATIGRPIGVVMSTDKKKGFHKPAVQLWQAAQHLLAVPSDHETMTKDWSIAESLYVGDSVGGDDDPQGGVDEGLARNVGALAGTTLQFFTPDNFFGPSHAAQRNGGSSATAVVKPVPPVVQSTRAALVSRNLFSRPGQQQQNKPIMLLLCGAQGSGKSTFATRLVQQSSSLSSLTTTPTTTSWKRKYRLVPEEDSFLCTGCETVTFGTTHTHTHVFLLSYG
jgi:DNA 3'-phosphatase